MPRRSGLKFTAPPPCTGVVPAPTVAGGPDLAAPAFGEAGSITLDGSRSGCYFKPCQFKFVVNCTGKPGVVKQGASTAKITIIGVQRRVTNEVFKRSNSRIQPRRF